MCTKTVVDSYLALKASANNAILTNLLQGQRAYFSGNVSVGSVLNVAGTSTFDGPVDITTGLLTAQYASFYGNINSNGILNSSGNLDVYGTTTFYGPVVFLVVLSLVWKMWPTQHQAIYQSVMRLRQP